MTMNRTKIETRIVSQKVHDDLPCYFCLERGSNEDAMVLVCDDGEDTGHNVCDRCLQLSPAELARTARETAEYLRWFARKLEAVAAHVPTLPYEEVLDARAAAEREAAEYRSSITASS